MTLPPPQQSAFTSYETRCAAPRWRPTTNTHHGKCVVLGPGFSLTMHDGMEPYAQAFAAAAAHVLALDYRGFGGSSGRCSAARVLPAAIPDAMGWHALVPVTGTPGARAAMTLPR